MGRHSTWTPADKDRLREWWAELWTLGPWLRAVEIARRLGRRPNGVYQMAVRECGHRTPEPHAESQAPYPNADVARWFREVTTPKE